MADLDDFFAKKDRKKGKTTKKFSSTDEVAKKLDDNVKKSDVKKKTERAIEGEEANANAHEQDEWKEFEEEKKDYTGLKIGNLTISQNNDGSQGVSETNSEQQSGDEIGQNSEKKSGPWNKLDVEQEAPPPPKIEEKKPTVNKAYVPPSLRNQIQQHSRPKQRGAPDVHNEELFPTLSKTNDHRKTRNEGNFEVVQHNKSSSYRHSEQSRISSAQGPKLSLGNRFNNLSHDS